MIVKSIQHVYGFVRDGFRTKVYRTLQDPVTGKEVVNCEIYTYKGVIDKMPEKGNNIDKKI